MRVSASSTHSANRCPPAVPDCSAAKTFYDWNGDGCGDIRGTTERIEYLSDLGVTCLWLMPFYPTARKDDGYDITDVVIQSGSRNGGTRWSMS